MNDIPDWMAEEQLEEIHGELAEEDKLHCPKCGSLDVKEIKSKTIHCLNCGMMNPRFKCNQCGHRWDEGL